jgi:hypothetical protein
MHDQFGAGAIACRCEKMRRRSVFFDQHGDAAVATSRVIRSRKFQCRMPRFGRTAAAQMCFDHGPGRRHEGRVMDDQHTPMFCRKCRVPMTFRALQHVDDPRKGGVEVEVYECLVCGRLTAAADAKAEPALH